MACEQTLAAVRLEIQEALNVLALTKGQLSFQATIETSRTKRKKVIDEETNQVLDLEPIRGAQSMGFKRSSCPLPDNAFFLSKVTNIVNELPKSLHSLALFCYSDSCSWDHVTCTAELVWGVFEKSNNKKLRSKKEAALKNMIFLAMQDWREQTLHGRVLHKPSRIQSLLNISEHTWRRDWLPHWRKMHSILTSQETKILESVYRGVNPKKHPKTA